MNEFGLDAPRALDVEGGHAQHQTRGVSVDLLARTRRRPGQPPEDRVALDIESLLGRSSA